MAEETAPATVDVAPAAPDDAAEAPEAAAEAALEVASAADEAIDEVAIIALEATEDVAIMALEAADEAMDEVISMLMDMLDMPPAADPPSLPANEPSSRLARADTRVMPSAWLLAQKLV